VLDPSALRALGTCLTTARPRYVGARWEQGTPRPGRMYCLRTVGALTLTSLPHRLDALRQFSAQIDGQRVHVGAALSDSLAGLAAWFGGTAVAWSSTRPDGTPAYRELFSRDSHLYWRERQWRPGARWVPQRPASILRCSVLVCLRCGASHAETSPRGRTIDA
jgi:hypothetical protein